MLDFLNEIVIFKEFRNPQTAKFCQWLGISDLNKMLIDLNPDEAVGLPYYMVKDSGDENEIKLDDSQVSLLESNNFFYKL